MNCNAYIVAGLTLLGSTWISAGTLTASAMDPVPSLHRQEPSAAPVEHLRVVATQADFADFLNQFGGPWLEVKTLVRPGHDPHMVLPKASLLLGLQRADGLILMGLDYEHSFLPALLEKCSNPAVKPGGKGYMNVSARIQALEVPDRLDFAAGADLHPRGNPHYNLDPENGRRMAEAVRDLLVAIDPGRAAHYQRKWQEWDRRAVAKISSWNEYLAPLKGQALVSYHRSWPYFAHHFGLRMIGEVEPKPGLRPSPRHLAELSALIQREGVKALLVEPWYPPSDTDKLVEREQLVRVVIPSTSGMGDSQRHYLDWFGHLVEAIGQAHGLGKLPVAATHRDGRLPDPKAAEDHQAPSSAAPPNSDG